MYDSEHKIVGLTRLRGLKRPFDLFTEVRKSTSPKFTCDPMGVQIYKNRRTKIDGGVPHNHTKDDGFARAVGADDDGFARTLTLWLSESARIIFRIWVMWIIITMTFHFTRWWLAHQPAGRQTGGRRANPLWVKWNVIAMTIHITHIWIFGRASYRTILRVRGSIILDCEGRVLSKIFKHKLELKILIKVCFVSSFEAWDWV